MVNRIQAVRGIGNYYCDHNGRYFVVCDSSSNNVRFFDLQRSTFRNVYSASVGFSPVGVACAGRYIYLIDSSGGVYQTASDTCKTVNQYTLPARTYRGLAFDGNYFYVHASSNIYKIDSNFNIISSFSAPANVSDLSFNGRYIVVFSGTNAGTGRVRYYDPGTGGQCRIFVTTVYTVGQVNKGLHDGGRYLYAFEVL